MYKSYAHVGNVGNIKTALKDVRTREQILKSHQKEVGHTLKRKNNPENILTEPTTPKHTINVLSVNRNTNYAHKSENNNM